MPGGNNWYAVIRYNKGMRYLCTMNPDIKPDCKPEVYHWLETTMMKYSSNSLCTRHVIGPRVRPHFSHWSHHYLYISLHNQLPIYLAKALTWNHSWTRISNLPVIESWWPFSDKARLRIHTSQGASGPAIQGVTIDGDDIQLDPGGRVFDLRCPLAQLSNAFSSVIAQVPLPSETCAVCAVFWKSEKAVSIWRKISITVWVPRVTTCMLCTDN